MSYAPLDDQFDDHPKFLEFTLAEMGLMATAITYATRNLTDGRIPRIWPERRFGAEGKRIAKQLVEVRGVWTRRPDGDFEIVGFLDHNPSREQVLAKKSIAQSVRAEAGRLGGLRSGEARRSKREANAKQVLEANAKQTHEANEPSLHCTVEREILPALETGSPRARPPRTLGRPGDLKIQEPESETKLRAERARQTAEAADWERLNGAGGKR